MRRWWPEIYVCSLSFMSSTRGPSATLVDHFAFFSVFILEGCFALRRLA